MTITVRAVYAGGVLRPVQPLALAEGETVEVAITPVGPTLRPPTREEEDYARRVREAHSLDELLTIQETALPLPDGYDLSRALNENRQASGERILFPERPQTAGDFLAPLVGQKQPPSPPPPPPPPREITNSMGMKLVRLPRGTFWMGDRVSQRQVEIPHDFYMGVHPVTQQQWQDVMGSNPSWFSTSGGGAAKVKGIPDAELKQFPVENVSFQDVQEFLKRLNAREKDSGYLYRFPTEAEWEYACRGGATSQKACDFDYYLSQPTNELTSRQANFGNSPGRTTKVGSYRPNRLGIYDMHGNVWEWCADDFEARASARVIRGGAWCSSGSRCRASDRYRREPVDRYLHLGFRVAAVPSAE